MGNWLDKALGRRGTTAVEVVPYERACQCGASYSGVRQKRAGRVICARCGTAHFVLPVNPYPASDRQHFELSNPPDNNVEGASDAAGAVTHVDLDVPSKHREASQRRKEDVADSLRTEPDIDIVEAAWNPDSVASDNANSGSYADDYQMDEEWDPGPDDNVFGEEVGEDYELADDEEPLEDDSAEDAQSLAEPERKRRPPNSVEGSSETAQDSVESPARLMMPSVSDDRREQRGRIVAVTGLIIVVVAAAIVWTARSRRIDQAEITMRESRDIGTVALSNRDFATAREKLRETVEAMELLGLDQAQLDSTRQLWLQAEAGFGLLDDTDVVEVAMAAEETFQNGDEEDWQRRFRGQYFDRWLVIQLPAGETLPAVEATETFDGVGRRVVFPSVPAIHLTGLDSVLLDESGSGGRLWFAAPLQSCRRDPTQESAWLIEFDSTRVIACDGTESLVRPMLTEDELAAVRDARAAARAESDGDAR